MSQRFEGIFPAVVTPFRPDGECSREDFQKHLEWLASQGVAGFVPCGTTGEGPTLTSEERRNLISDSVTIAKRHSLLTIAGCGSNSTVQVCKLVKEAADLGADAALVVTPYYNKPTPEGLVAHYQAVAESSPIPIILYNVPSRTGVNLTPQIVETLSKISKIVGLKEASGLHAQWLALSEKLPLDKFSLLAGDDDAFATLLGLGSCGIISAAANVAPALYVRLHKLFKNGQAAEAFILQKRILPLVRALFIETNPSPTKYALSYMGKMKPSVRLPLVELRPESRIEVEQALKRLELV